MRVAQILPALMLTAASTLLQVPPSHADQERSNNGEARSEPKEFVTRHAIEIGGELLRYTAIAGETFLRDSSGKAKASLFTISYLLDGIDDHAWRPLTFVFNGGPGSSAVWLHLGAFGAKRIIQASGKSVSHAEGTLLTAADEGKLVIGGPPYELGTNVYTLLGVTDLVFVDPIGTGYSHAFNPAQDQDYWGVDEDSASIADFIRTYLTQYHRWSSPKYLAGESYGSIRAALLVRDLGSDSIGTVTLNGVILISSALDVRIFLAGAPGNDLAYVTSLPTYTATAHYHGQLGENADDPEHLLDQARRFAATEYLTALFQGENLPEQRAAEIAARLHQFTGLSQEYLLRSNLRVSGSRFTKELLRHRGETIGLHDTRYLGQDPDEAGELVCWDPFLSSQSGAFTATINSYLAAELEVDLDRPYEIFAMEAPTKWKRAASQNGYSSGYLNTTSHLAQAAAVNSDFRIFVASGYHDLTTTFFGVEYTINHSGIDSGRITLKNYHGGHMFYIHEPSLARLSADLKAFIEGWQQNHRVESG